MNNIFKYLSFTPSVGEGVFVAHTALIIGRVELSKNSNIWFHSVVRGDVNKIKIGENTNVQDLCMLHVTEDNPLTIGKNVSIGHSVVLHGCEIGDGCLIGMGSKILDRAVIGEGSLVAAGSVVPPNKTFPKNSYIMGVPAKLIRVLTEEEINKITNHYKSYLGYKDQYLDNNIFNSEI